jgi:hypothetical protein
MRYCVAEKFAGDEFSTFAEYCAANDDFLVGGDSIAK